MTAAKAWAVLAYTVADDKGGGGSLDATVKHELRALCDAADFGAVSIAAQVDFKRPKGVYRGSLTAKPPKPRGFEPVRDEDHPLWRKILGAVEQSTVRVLVERKDLNAANAGVLEDFLTFGRAECPAERYVVFFYGHAYGPMGLFYDREADSRVANTLRLNDLAGSMRQSGGRAAVVVFRDCFMNTLETAYQLQTAAEFMIATQALAPIAGVWPWVNFLATLSPGAASADVARGIAMQLGHFLNTQANRGPFADVPYSLLDLDAVSGIVEPLTALATELDGARSNARRRAACAKALEAARVGYPDDVSRPGDPALIDVLTMCDGLAALGRDAVAAPAAALASVLRNRVIRWHHTQADAYRGVSVYYKPVTARDLERSYIQAGNDEDAAEDAAHYRTLALCQATGWDRIALDPLVP